MKINSIKLCNIGSYEGESFFDTQTNDDKNIIIVGGKNGAGKTTLFNAIRIALYGYRSMGFKNAGVGYVKAVKKFINDRSKLINNAKAYVELEISIDGRQSEDKYILRREWSAQGNINENVFVSLNGKVLSETEISDFEKYILDIIPTDLFDLYFFDGESIADFFLDDEGNKRLKEAFLTLCGYDTFEIMRKNFQRSITGKKVGKKSANAYFDAKKNYDKTCLELSDVTYEIQKLTTKVLSIDSELDELEKIYTQSGGLSKEEWLVKQEELKNEEKKREVLNGFIRKSANDTVPFIILKKQLVALDNQLRKENESFVYDNFSSVLAEKKIKTYLNDLDPNAAMKLRTIALSIYGKPSKNILGLSPEQKAKLSIQINEFLNYDNQIIIDAKNNIKKSIAKSAEIREYLDTHNIENVERYNKMKLELFNKKASTLEKIVLAEKEKSSLEQKLNVEAQTYSKAKIAFENEIKNESINDISSKSVLMLETLQERLLLKQVEFVQKNVMDILLTLMRKEHLIDDIIIDKEFNLHLYKAERVSYSKVYDALAEMGKDEFERNFGDKAVAVLKEKSNEDDWEKIQAYCRNKTGFIILPMLRDKQNLSKGEKQILIMALYYALIKLSHHKMPFIIDTPFARIDTEHRKNISENFFRKLNGQVFILSTNEEIDSDHMAVLKEQIGCTYLLENNLDIKTTVFKDKYFGE